METQSNDTLPGKRRTRRRWGKWNRQDAPLVYNSLDDLLQLLAEERQKTLRTRRKVKIILGFYFGFAVLMGIIGIATSFKNIGGFGGMFGGLGGLIASMYAATQTQYKAMKELAQFNDVQMVPRLVEMLEYHAPDLRSDAAALLQKLLPLLKASDAPLLTPEHHAILNRMLSNKIKPFAYWQDELRLAVLTALQQVGDESSLLIVSELAEGRGKGASNPAVRQAAQDCLPFLRARVEHLRQTQTLLRASDGLVTCPDILLRPAFDADPNTHAGELLRSTSENALSPDMNLPATIAFPMSHAALPEEQQTARLS